MNTKKKKNILKNIEIWKNRLLDLSMKNQSINYRKTKLQTVEIIYPGIEIFLNKLYGLKNLQFASLFGEVVENEDGEVTSIKRVRGKRVSFGIELEQKERYFKNEINPLINAFTKKYKGNYLFSNLYETIQNRNLLNLMKRSNLFKEENGINVLYFAVGFLEWYENNELNEKRIAPLLFIPVELSKDAYKSPYKINFLDDEFLLNESLVQKLINEYNIDLNYEFKSEKTNFDLYKDYKNFVLNEVSKLGDKRWKIVDDIDLGIFSFSKINMVKDLEENTSKLLDNKFVQLISGIEHPIENIKYTEADIDKIVKADEYFHIYDSDSSQEIAIQAANSGQSFVLQGPPGTGKSQTITNIITESIARGKKVLFVAEKQAALEVVYNNLKRIGLNDFVLPIHNTKLDKKVVLDELNSTLEKGQNNLSIETNFHQDAINKFNTSHEELLDYPKSIQNIFQPINKNIYQLYGIFFKYSKLPDIIFDIENVENISEQELIRRRKLIDSFHNALNINDFDISKNDWYGLKATELSLEEKEKMILNLKELKNKINEVMNFSNDFSLLKVKKDIFLKSASIYNEVFKHLTKLNSINSVIFDNKNSELDTSHYKSMVEIKEKIENLSRSIKENYNLQVTKISAKEYRVELANYVSLFKRITSPTYKKIKSKVLLYKFEKKISYVELVELINTISKIQDLEEELQGIAKLTSYRIPTDDFIFLKNTYEQIDWFNTFKKLVYYLKWDINTVYQLFSFAMLNKEKMQKLSNEYDSLYIKLKKHLDKVKNDFDQNLFNIELLTFSELDTKLEQIFNNWEHLTTILEFNRVYNLMEKNNLKTYADVLIAENIKDNYFGIYLRRFYVLLIDKYQNELFPDFNGEVLDSIRKTFNKSSATIQSMAKTKVEMAIIEKIPNYNSIQGLNSEVSILRTEANKSRKILPFRVLFDKIPNLITKLKPCLMMSPLSVSSLLKNSNLEFDIVIFDEASQVRPENAIGALSRAKQFIIAGDKEQLPPTDFFAHFDEDEDDTINSNWDTTAFDSILEVANIVLPTIKLKWHYRSKFDELIEPSNKEIYNDLVTFPAPKIIGEFEGVTHEYVNGKFIDSVNEVEADKVVELVVNIIKKYGTRRTIGVVTFNTQQRDLIERKINALRRKTSDFEHFFNAFEIEKFFVKNIETVQGDERDIIILSVGYGPNAKGVMSMNFGPLNHQNGYRRLNVAVTRAKTAVIVVSSFKESDIDLSRTSARGVKFLKNYIAYAADKYKMLEKPMEYLSEFESPFEDDVYNELKSLGYNIHKKIGSSDYKIDIAVVHPKKPNHYILGIECDGSAYKTSRSARDRDDLRQKVLRNRNWNIYRLWSTDWYKNKTKQIEKLTKYIDELILSKLNIKNKSTNLVDALNIDVPVEITEKIIEHISFTPYPNYSDLFDEIKSKHPETESDFVLQLINELSPIHYDELKKFIPKIFNRKTLTNALKVEYDDILNLLAEKDEVEIVDNFIVIKNQVIEFRENNKNSTKRDFARIHINEVEHFLLSFIEKEKNLSLNAIMFTFSKYCGFSTITPISSDLIYQAIERLQNQNKIILEDEVITWKE